jgi:2,4-dienoyl-CoA reductase-like NADH-dependent reductase (Old Yellow Enzyme family)
VVAGVTGALPPFLRPGRIGALEVPNRIIRAGTGESTAGPDGAVTERMVGIHRVLARGGVGLAFTGHMYVQDRGRYGKLQTGISSDAHLPGLAGLVSAVHREGGLLFAQLAHAGSQSMMSGILPLAPSPVPNVMTGRMVPEAADDEIDAAVEAWGTAARRAVDAGFDGVHLHGANGYLISEFLSPLTNRRTDRWGGSARGRLEFPTRVVRHVRRCVPEGYPVTMKLGLCDLVDEPGGLDLDAAIGNVARLTAVGLDAVEVSSNLMSDYVSGSIRAYVAVDRRRALRDLLINRVFRDPEPEAYFRGFAHALRSKVDTTVILVGGLRQPQTMSDVITSGDADFISLARPLIREPDLVQRLTQDPEAVPKCVSCNICIMHDEHHWLRCWRDPKGRLALHAWYRLTGEFAHGSGRKPQADPFGDVE